MDFRQLRYFVAVAECESFSKAAVLLSVSQPALSRQLGAIEQEFGVELFCRTGRGVVLTERGQQLLAHARAVLENVRQMRADMTATESSPVGNVIVGIPPMIGSVLTPQLVRDFCATYPRISLHVMEGLSGHVYEWLTTGRVDVAILYNAPATSTLIAEPLLRDDLGLVCAGNAGGPPGSSVRMSELGAFPLIAPSRAHGLRTIAETSATRNGVQLDVRMQIDSWQMMLELVRAGMGYAVLPYTPVRHEVEAGKLRFWHLREPCMTGVLSLAASSQRPRTPATRHLMSSIRQQVRQMVTDGRWRQEEAPRAPEPRQPVSRLVGELRTH
jgi:LysR family nitrogen assimilation transcriptional regulator